MTRRPRWSPTMTSATGRPMNPNPGRGGCHRDAGFTLVEILVVIAIIISLFAIVAVAAGSIRSRGNQKAAEAQILKLMTLIEDYKSKVGHYPLDGIDSEVKNAEGEKVVGSAALYYALSTPIRVKE